MKILAYTYSYASKTVTFITNELKQVDNQHDLLLVYSERVNPDNYYLKKMYCIAFKFNKIVNKLRWWLEQTEVYYTLYNIKFGKEINKVIRDFNPDIIHCHFGIDFLKLFSNLDKENKNRKFLISFYGYDVTERIKNRAVLRCYQKLLSVPNIYSVSVSNSLANNINTLIKPFHLVQVLPSGVDTDFFKRKLIKKEKEEFIFLQVSSFVEKKGHKYTLEAFKKFIETKQSNRYKFIIAGFGPLEDEIKTQIKTLNLNDYVEIRGSVTPSEMVDLASSADCFVHMSITAENGDQEGLPNVILEAMSLELPILSTVHAGIPDIIINGQNGILCYEKNIDEYVAAFGKIIDWSILPKNRQRIVEKYSLLKHMDELNKIYDSIHGLN